jgi:hypothetical protein
MIRETPVQPMNPIYTHKYPVMMFGSAAPRLFRLSRTTNGNVRAADIMTGKVEPLVAGLPTLREAIQLLSKLYPTCGIESDFFLIEHQEKVRAEMATDRLKAGEYWMKMRSSSKTPSVRKTDDVQE